MSCQCGCGRFLHLLGDSPGPRRMPRFARPRIRLHVKLYPGPQPPHDEILMWNATLIYDGEEHPSDWWAFTAKEAGEDAMRRLAYLEGIYT